MSLKYDKKENPMDSTKVFCPNELCPARGQIGEGNITVHDRKKRRYRCNVCRKPFSERKGTPFYRLRTDQKTVTQVLKLLSYGCPLQAIVFAFELDECTVAAWQARAGQQCQSLQEHLVEKPRDLGEVQMDEIRVKMQARVVGWMAMAIQVSTRLWLGGVVAPVRDSNLIGQLVARVKGASSALSDGLLFVTDGLASYPTQIKEVFREAWRSGAKGRPNLIEWPNIHIVQVVKRYVGGRLESIERRVVQGSAEKIEALRHKVAGGGVLNTAFIERLNSTFRSHISPLCRRTRAQAQQTARLHCAMYLTGAVYNFCLEHTALRMPGLIGGHKWLARTPAMAAGLTDHCWTMEELLNYHVPPPRWSPPKQRGRPSRALEALIRRWA